VPCGQRRAEKLSDSRTVYAETCLDFKVIKKTEQLRFGKDLAHRPKNIQAIAF
jgi:hypothetical protein